MIKLKETVEWPDDYSERFDCSINLRKALNWIKKHFVESKTLTKSTNYCNLIIVKIYNFYNIFLNHNYYNLD